MRFLSFVQTAALVAAFFADSAASASSGIAPTVSYSGSVSGLHLLSLSAGLPLLRPMSQLRKTTFEVSGNAEFGAYVASSSFYSQDYTPISNISVLINYSNEYDDYLEFDGYNQTVDYSGHSSLHHIQGMNEDEYGGYEDYFGFSDYAIGYGEYRSFYGHQDQISNLASLFVRFSDGDFVYGGGDDALVDPDFFGFNGFQWKLTFEYALQPGSSPDTPLLPDLGPPGTFSFAGVTVHRDEIIYLDPAVAVGYTYSVAGGPLISSAEFETVAGDLDGYDIYDLANLVNTIGHVGGVDPLTFTFASPLSGFQLRGINPLAGLDPANTQAFVTGLTFDRDGVVDIMQTPLTALVTAGVPEAATWAYMLAGFAMAGVATRKRKSLSRVPA